MFDVITIGTATRDVFLQSPLFRVLKDPKHLKRIGFPTGEAQCFALGGKVQVSAPVFAIGGGAANAAVTFAQQGLRTAAIMKIGADKEGDAILRAMKSENITSLVSRDKKDITAYSTILLSGTGERTILTYRGASEDLAPFDIPRQKLRARWAYIVPGKIPYPVIVSVMKHLQRNGTRIAMNPSRHYLELGAKKLKPLFDMLSVVIVNREEAAYLTKTDYAKKREIMKKFDALVPGIAVITDGPGGVLVSDGERRYEAGTFREKKIVDRTGAGDAFGSGFVAGLARTARKHEDAARAKRHGEKLSLRWIEKEWQKMMHEALRLASANATSVVEHIGAEPGILTRRAFEKSPRWRNLPIRSTPLF